MLNTPTDPLTIRPVCDKAPVPYKPNASAVLEARVVVLTNMLSPYVAGVHQNLAKCVREFIVLVSIDQEPNRDFGNAWHGLDVRLQKSWMIRRPWKHPQGGFQDNLYVHIPYDTFSQLKITKPDIVFSNELGFRSLISALYCRLFRKKLALWICASQRTEQGRGKLRHALRKRLLRLADAVAYNGPSCREYLKRYGVPDSKLYHFPYCVAKEFIYTGAIEREPMARRRLVVVGQLIARKGIVPMLKTLIQYCRNRPNQIVELDIVGKGTEEAAIRAIELPSNLKLQMRGTMPYSELAQAFETCGIMLFPTLADEWGLVVNEAMQAGMPVIGSEYAQASVALIHDGENGWCYNPDSPETLFRALDAMYSRTDSQLLAMRHAAQQTVADITPENVAQKALTMFQFLASSSS